jgi:hypothetical protein
MEAPRLPQPSAELRYIVLWRDHGLYRVCAYPTFGEAYKVYDSLITLARVSRFKDRDFAVYIMYLFIEHTL